MAWTVLRAPFHHLRFPVWLSSILSDGLTSRLRACPTKHTTHTRGSHFYALAPLLALYLYISFRFFQFSVLGIRYLPFVLVGCSGSWVIALDMSELYYY